MGAVSLTSSQGARDGLVVFARHKLPDHGRGDAAREQQADVTKAVENRASRRSKGRVGRDGSRRTGEAIPPSVEGDEAHFGRKTCAVQPSEKL